MNPEIKRQWVDALRSGEYEQGYGQLRVLSDAVGDPPSYSYCCLGVLCDLAAKAGVGRWQHIDFYQIPPHGEYKEDTVLPYAVRQWAGIDDEGGGKHDYTVTDPTDGTEKRYRDQNLIFLNDEAGLDFNQIADIIERYL